MPNFTRLEHINNGSLSLPELMSYPATGFTYFWALILFVIWVVIVTSTFFEERDRLGKGNILSSFAIASFGIMVLTWMGTLVGFINNEVSVMTTVFSLIFIVIWFLKGD